MKKVLRLEILIDSVATNQIVSIIQKFPEITFSTHQASTIQMEGQVVSRDDFSHSIAYHFITLFLPEKSYPLVEKGLKQILKNYTPSVYLSECRQILYKENHVAESV